MRWRSSALGLVAVLVLLVGLSAGSGAVWGSFSAQTTNPGNELRSAPDFVAPVTGAATLQKAAGGTPGYIRSGGSYRLFAAVTDSGRPSSGIASVYNGGPTGTPLTAGTYPAVGGVTYSHRSAALTFGTASAGSYTFSIGSTDGAGNSGTQSGFGYVVDNTAPTGYDVNTTNRSGGIVGRAEAGDAMTLSYSEPIDPISVSSDWDGVDPLDVIAYVANSPNSGGNDYVALYSLDTGALLPLGTIDLGRTDYTSVSRFFGQTGTPSKLTASGNDLKITFGTAAGATTTAGGSGTLRWTLATRPTDRAGNPLAAATLTARGTAAREF